MFVVITNYIHFAFHTPSLLGCPMSVKGFKPITHHQSQIRDSVYGGFYQQTPKQVFPDRPDSHQQRARKLLLDPSLPVFASRPVLPLLIEKQLDLVNHDF